MTNAACEAQPTSWTLGSVAGTDNNTIKASIAGGTTTEVTFTASANAGAATHVVVETAADGSGTA